jgi:hypothetical protein
VCIICSSCLIVFLLHVKICIEKVYAIYDLYKSFMIKFWQINSFNFIAFFQTCLNMKGHMDNMLLMLLFIDYIVGVAVGNYVCCVSSFDFWILALESSEWELMEQLFNVLFCVCKYKNWYVERRIIEDKLKILKIWYVV